MTVQTYKFMGNHHLLISCCQHTILTHLKGFAASEIGFANPALAGNSQKNRKWTVVNFKQVQTMKTSLSRKILGILIGFAVFAVSCTTPEPTQTPIVVTAASAESVENTGTDGQAVEESQPESSDSTIPGYPVNESITSEESSTESYPVTEPTQESSPATEAYPVSSEEIVIVSLFKIEKPVSIDANSIQGSGVAGVAIQVISVSQQGEPLGSGVVSEDGSFSVQLSRQLDANETVGLTLPDDSDVLQYGEASGATDIPLVGVLFDSARVSE